MIDLTKMIASYKTFYKDGTKDLFQAMAGTNKKVAMLNPFLESVQAVKIIKQAQKLLVQDFTFYQLDENIKPFLINGFISHYFLDYSSLIAPLYLPIKPKMHVLDMCSAPGGKLLAMIKKENKDVIYTVNDISKTRLNRLKNVLQNFLPKDFLTKQIRIKNRDATYFGLKQQDQYDAILLDAPCSNERHVLKNKKMVESFSGLNKNLPYRQYSLLSAALLALKKGGHVMYATCSINKNENESVIQKIIQKKSHMCSLVKVCPPIGETNELGTTVLPHVHNAGPAFFSLLKRV